MYNISQKSSYGPTFLNWWLGLGYPKVSPKNINVTIPDPTTIITAKGIPYKREIYLLLLAYAIKKK